MSEDNAERDGEKKKIEPWLAHYADLIILLLGLVVVVYSISRMDTDKLRLLPSALHSIFGGYTTAETPVKMDDAAENKAQSRGRESDLLVLKRDIAERLGDAGLSGSVVFESELRGLVITVPESELFEPGSAKLTSRAATILDLISGSLIGLTNHVRVETYAGDFDKVSGKSVSGWELSLARAVACAEYLVEEDGIRAERISASGYPSSGSSSIVGISERHGDRILKIVILNGSASVFEPRRLDLVISAAP